MRLDALDATSTLPTGNHVWGEVQEFALTVVEGPEAGRVWQSKGARCSMGTHECNDLKLSDPTVSRFHCEIRIENGAARLLDPGSKNGTFIDGLRVRDAYLRGNCLLRVGNSALRFQSLSTTHRLEVSPKTEFGILVGASRAMRAIFPVLEKAAACNAKVLLEGESGTGKGVTAESIHQESARRNKPFGVVDCGAIASALIESELFGHERGAFTGADRRHVGQFEQADGGTLFLDEVGELSPDLQLKLLRVLDTGQIRPVGASVHRKVDVRLIAATKRDLKADVNAGRFRDDLYYRLAVICVRMPALREHLEDMPLLIDRILRSLGAAEHPSSEAILRSPEMIARLQRATWPGNVRELRNYIERCLALGPTLPGGDTADALQPEGTPQSLPPVDPRTPYHVARLAALHLWEDQYLRVLLEQQQGNVEQAARAAGIGRAYMYRLVSRHGLRQGRR